MGAGRGKLPLTTSWGSPEPARNFAKKIQQYVGASGFMLMAQVDHSRPIGKYGIQRRLLRWIFGNPLIAITMLRHDYTAGLFVPIELLLAESDDGASCGARAGRQGRSSGRRGRDD
jgi:Domain of unknown function DUF302